MIKNQLQYKVTSAHLKRFQDELARAKAITNTPEGVHPRMWLAQKEALESQIYTLKRELDEYDALTSGLVTTIEVQTLEELPVGLIKARIAKGLTQKELADVVGVKPQQIQRWEDENYHKAKFEQLIRIADALSVSVSERISFAREAKTALGVLKTMGIDVSFIKRRICPTDATNDAEILAACSSFLKRIWGIVVNPDGHVDSTGLILDGARLARFKIPKNADETRLKAYAQYAYTIAEIVGRSEKSNVTSIPRDWKVVRSSVERYGQISLEACLNYAWDMGVPIVPLSDSIRFHGGCWRISGRNVIVLKQANREESRWLFDLLHELYHASEVEANERFSAVDLDGTDPSRRESEDEISANEFAGNVLLDGRAEVLFAAVLQTAQNEVSRIKRSVTTVSKAYGVNVGLLANYVAFRLRQEYDVDWWGAAANLQMGADDAYSVTQSVFKTRCNFEGMAMLDRTIVEMAVTEPAL